MSPINKKKMKNKHTNIGDEIYSKKKVDWTYTYIFIIAFALGIIVAHPFIMEVI